MAAEDEGKQDDFVVHKTDPETASKSGISPSVLLVIALVGVLTGLAIWKVRDGRLLPDEEPEPSSKVDVSDLEKTKTRKKRPRKTRRRPRNRPPKGKNEPDKRTPPGKGRRTAYSIGGFALTVPIKDWRTQGETFGSDFALTVGKKKTGGLRIVSTTVLPWETMEEKMKALTDQPWQSEPTMITIPRTGIGIETQGNKWVVVRNPRRVLVRIGIVGKGRMYIILSPHMMRRNRELEGVINSFEILDSKPPLQVYRERHKLSEEEAKGPIDPHLARDLDGFLYFLRSLKLPKDATGAAKLYRAKKLDKLGGLLLRDSLEEYATRKFKPPFPSRAMRRKNPDEKKPN